MKKLFQIGFVTVAALSCSFVFIFSTLAHAVKPGEEVNPNGFPSGEHYNLNIHGKKAEFTCPELELDEFDNPIYGNSIFIPEDGAGEILMESGSGKGKKTESITTLQVTDPCSQPFDNDPAIVQIPANGKGYEVYARALAKPTDMPFMTVEGSLYGAEDDAGNDLIYLGLVDSTGFVTPDKTFTRSKGKSKAVPITGMFEWSGQVCYLTPDNYCLDGECTDTDLCCVDADLDGVYEECESATNYLDGICPEDTFAVVASCKDYTEEWVFNIADFVTYLWDTNNNGLKLLQIRFYPVK